MILHQFTFVVERTWRLVPQVVGTVRCRLFSKRRGKCGEIWGVQEKSKIQKRILLMAGMHPGHFFLACLGGKFYDTISSSLVIFQNPPLRHFRYLLLFVLGTSPAAPKQAPNHRLAVSHFIFSAWWMTRFPYYLYNQSPIRNGSWYNPPLRHDPNNPRRPEFLGCQPQVQT